MNYYENWDTFAFNIHEIPENLPEDDIARLEAMVSKLSCSPEEMASLRERAVEGDRLALEDFIMAHAKMVFQSVKKFEARIGYFSLTVFLNSLENVRACVANSLYYENFECTADGIDRIVSSETDNYPAAQKDTPEKKLKPSRQCLKPVISRRKNMPLLIGTDLTTAAKKEPLVMSLKCLIRPKKE